ncbi:MAG: DsrE family protein [Bacteroidales bacterium]|nr:DsrE family protein [Bacteroidales bacterium]
MKKFTILLVVFLLAVSCIRVNENPVPQVNMSRIAETEGIFIHVKQGADNQHEVLMALSMAAKFAPDYDVLMYFDIDGIEMVTKDAPNLEMEPFGSSDGLFNKLVNAGVTLFACPGCMEVAGVKPSDLRTGVTPAEKHEFFDFTDGRILSIDY